MGCLATLLRRKLTNTTYNESEIENNNHKIIFKRGNEIRQVVVNSQWSCAWFQ